jgi:short-subunit dehydrogenase
MTARPADERHAAKRLVAVIAGASRGIGAATAVELARRGYTLVLAARSEDALHEVRRRIESLGAVAVVIPTDVRCRASIAALASAVLEKFGGPDVLLLNSGIHRPGLLVADTCDADVDGVLETNLRAAIEITRALLPSMVARGRGVIGFVDSVGGHIGLPSAALYSATKFGLRGFATALRREVAGSGVAVVIVSPGFVATEMTASVREVFRGLPLRMATPERVARVIARTIERPRREVVVPGYYRAFMWMERAIPGAMDFAMSIYMRHIMPRYARLQKDDGDEPADRRT